MSSIFSFFRKIFLNCANRLWPVADGAGNGIARLADQARCQEEILRIDLPEHADHADSVAHLSGRVTHRRGNRAQADLELPVFHGVALLADLLKLGLELNGEKQKLSGAVVFPEDYLNPRSSVTGELRKTENTHSIHWYSASWMPWHKRLRSAISKPVHFILGRAKGRGR